MVSQLNKFLYKYYPLFTIAQALIPITWFILVHPNKVAAMKFEYLDIIYITLIVGFAIVQGCKEYNQREFIEEEIRKDLGNTCNNSNAEYLTSLISFISGFLKICYSPYRINVLMYLLDSDNIHLRKSQRFIEGEPTYGQGLERFNPKIEGRTLTISDAYINNRFSSVDLTKVEVIYDSKIAPDVDKDLKWVLAMPLRDNNRQAIGVICFNSVSQPITDEDSRSLGLLIRSLSKALSDILSFKITLRKECNLNNNKILEDL